MNEIDLELDWLVRGVHPFVRAFLARKVGGRSDELGMARRRVTIGAAMQVNEQIDPPKEKGAGWLPWFDVMWWPLYGRWTASTAWA